MSKTIDVGTPAPDHAWSDANGAHRLSELWAEAPTLVLWLRHCG